MIRRLNGWKMIMVFLGRFPRSRRSWRILRERFGDLIYCDPRTGHLWAMADDLIAADKARCLTMTEFLKARGPKEANQRGELELRGELSWRIQAGRESAHGDVRFSVERGVSRSSAR